MIDRILKIIRIEFINFILFKIWKTNPFIFHKHPVPYLFVLIYVYISCDVQINNYPWIDNNNVVN